jgi:hypothetical protein
MLTDWNHADIREPSYFNFLMTNPVRRRAGVPFVQAAGFRPDRARDVGVTPADVLTAASGARMFRRI